MGLLSSGWKCRYWRREVGTPVLPGDPRTSQQNGPQSPEAMTPSHRPFRYAVRVPEVVSERIYPRPV